MAEPYRVEMKGISKSFGGVRALKNVDLAVRPGEILGLVGENGAGKSTLMKILSGALQKDRGQILIDGKPVEIPNPRAGLELGIAIIYQEFALVPDLTVSENIFLGANPGAVVNWEALHRRAGEALTKLGFDINPRLTVRELSVAHQQVVEIAKALTRNARILVLDEPTAVLAPAEAERLFELLGDLKRAGISIIYISHRLDEVFRLSDEITVMKDGEVVGTMKASETNTSEIISMMVGRELATLFPAREVTIGEEVLRVEHISVGNRVKDVSFSVRAGEVFGIAGLVGSGRTELVRAIFGADRRDSGQVFLDGKPVVINSPAAAVRLGIGLVPEDRKTQGLILEHAIRTNVTMPCISNVMRALGFIDFKKETEIVEDQVKKLSIKIASIQDPVSSLSGGNQQKVSLAKWFASNSRVLILDEPTRGVDVGAKVEIYDLINQAVKQGVAVIFISSELEEVVGMCDRVLVMSRGVPRGFLEKPDISEKNIMRLAVGEEAAS